MKTKIFCLFILSIVLSSCAPAPPAVSVEKKPSNTPRWVLYESALSDIFLGPPGETLQNINTDHGLCEWEIWGQKENEVYVWALCQANNSVGTATSAPAVIRLEKGGTIAEVEMPEEGFGNLRELFPVDVLAKIERHEFPADTAWDRIQKRKNDSSLLPLIVEQGIPLP
jgi:hypothetical protein